MALPNRSDQLNNRFAYLDDEKTSRDDTSQRPRRTPRRAPRRHLSEASNPPAASNVPSLTPQSSSASSSSNATPSFPVAANRSFARNIRNSHTDPFDDYTTPSPNASRSFTTYDSDSEVLNPPRPSTSQVNRRDNASFGDPFTPPTSSRTVSNSLNAQASTFHPTSDRSILANYRPDASRLDTADFRRSVFMRRLADIQEQMEQLQQAQVDLDDDSPDLSEFVTELEIKRSEVVEELAKLTSTRDTTPTTGSNRPIFSPERGLGRWSLRSRRQLGSYRPVRRGDTRVPDDLAYPVSRADSDNNPDDGEDNRHPAAFLYTMGPAPIGSDVWPDMRDPSKVPARYIPIQSRSNIPIQSNARTKPSRKVQHTDAPVEYNGSQDPFLTWPKSELPSEIYYLITDHLSRDDIKAMRLTCQEFEHHISCVLFRTVVVPFNTEIYGMLHGNSGSTKIDAKGKGKMKASDVVGFWKNSKADDIYTGHGIDVFRSFGPRMKKFGMSFEVDEDSLANPPLKGTREAHKSYWGEYSWPYPEYQRFEQVAGLEDAADETPKMKSAFSLLGEVQELALSLDSGLGWISGPDQSIRSRILRRPHAVFESKHHVPERKIQAQRDLWHHLKSSCADDWSSDLRHSAIFHRQMAHTYADFLAIQRRFIRLSPPPEMPYIDLHPLVDPTITNIGSHPPCASAQRYPDTPMAGPDPMVTDPFDENFPPRPDFVGGLITIKEDLSDHERFEHYPIVPNSLSKLQKEWLLETEWAQRAFLSSYLVAIVDSRVTFHNVHTLNFARISSRFLHSLGRNDFWNALPNVNTVNLQVIADWRDVIKDNAGFVETPRVSLTAATFSFQKLLTDMIAPRRSIKALKIGWACGGEHARGLHARNRHLMPAPILPQDWMASVESITNNQLLDQRMIDFRHVESFTLKNCWMPPYALISLVKRHEGLVKLTLDSVSLTAPLVLNVGMNQHQQHFVAQMGGMGMLMPPIPAQAALQPLQNGGQAGQGAQQGSLFNVNHLYIPPAAVHAQPQVPAPALAPGSWHGPHRTGSWPDILDTISPGTTLATYGSTTSPNNIVISNPNSKLKSLTLNSCGYACLHNPRLDESAIQLPAFGGGSAWFTKRFAALSKVMMVTKSLITAEVVQCMPAVEIEAVETAWGCSVGWPPLLGNLEEENDAEAAVYDGCLPGGTGRFSGRVTIQSRALPETNG